MSFYEQMRDSNPHTWEEVISHYKQEYPGEKTNKKGVTSYEWQSKLATDVSSLPVPEGKKQVKRASVMRRFQAGRKEKISEKHQSEYASVGESLPLKVPAGGYHISGPMTVKYSDGSEWDATINETITGEDAETLAQLSPDEMTQALANYYQTGDFGQAGPAALSEDLHVDAL